MSHPKSRRIARSLARLGVCALGLSVAAGGLTLVAPAQAAVIDDLSGTGTAADPIVIDSVADLDAVAAQVNSAYATYGSLHYRLGADIDYAGGTFATFQRFTGVLDGNGHQVTDLTLRPGTTADAADANATQTGFVQVLDGTIRNLTLKRLTSLTTGSSTARVQQGGFAGRSSGGTITGSALIDSTVRSSDNTDNSSAVGGLVGKTVGTATTTISDSMLDGTTVSGDKRVGGVVGWQNTATDVKRNLVVSTSVGHAAGSGAGAAFVTGHTICAGTLTGNVVVSGSISQVPAAGYGWIRSASGCTSADNLVNADNNIDPGAPVGATATPDPNPYDVFWKGTTLLTESTWTRADLGTYVTPAALAQQATYAGVGWDFAAGTGAWRWAVDLGHPVPAHADIDGYDEISYLLDGGTNGANPTAYTATAGAITLAAPTREGHTFAGWTGTGLTQPTPEVTIPTGSTGDRDYVATWTATSWPITVDLAGGTLAEPAPTDYTIESGDLTLPTPTRQGHTFAGWTGTGIDGVASTVTIPSGSTGPRSYVATWTLGAATIDGVTGDGSAESPYLVGTAAELDAVAAAINTDHATYGSRHLELTADVDYGGGTFAGVHRFSGVLDGAGHAISDLTVAPWVDGDTERVSFFGRLDGATVTGLALSGIRAVKTGTVLATGVDLAVASGLTTLATSSTIQGVTLTDATVRNESAQGENPFDAGFVSRVAGTGSAPTVVTDNLLGGDVTVYSAGKYASAFVGYQAAHSRVGDNLVVADPEGGYTVENAAGGANMNAALLVNYVGAAMDGQEIAGNVVLSGSVYSYATGTTGNTVSWIAGYNHAQVDTYGTNLVTTDHNRTGFPQVAETEAQGHPLRWTRRAGTAYAHSVANLWVLGNDGTPTSPAQLREQTTYADLGWDLDGVWRWDASAQHPVLRAATPPVVDPPVITVGRTRASYRVGATPTATEVLASLGASVDRGVLGIDLSAVDFTTPGTYAATVSATDGDSAAAPVAVSIVVSELEGAGTAASPYLVATAADLDAAVAMVNADQAQDGPAAATYELTADIDHDGAPFTTFGRFSGTIDGDGHTISGLTLIPGTAADTADANATQTGFVQVLQGTITDLTLQGLRSVTAGGDTARVQQGGFAGRASGATITRSALIDATVRSSDNTDNSSAVGGLVGKSTGSGNTVTDNLLAGVTVSGDKRVGGVFGWVNVDATVSRTLVVDASLTQNGSSGAGAAFINGHSVCVGTVTGNVVLSGAIRQTSPAGFGWISSAATGCVGTDNLVDADNNIDPTTPVGQTGTPATRPNAVFWSGSTTLDTPGAWTRGDLGTYTSRADLAQQATYAALGWDFADGSGAWRWDADRRHPVPVGVTFPTVEVTVDLAGGTDGGANPTEHGVALDRSLVAPTRVGYTFAGWTGPGITGTALAVTLPRYPAGALSYVATWTPVAYPLAYDLAGGAAAGNPASYTVETSAFALGAPTRVGYAFAGWTGTGLAGATTAVTVPSGSTGPRSYVATWKAIVYSIVYELEDDADFTGAVPGTYTIESATITLPTPSRPGHEFAGWIGTGLAGPTAVVTVPTGSAGVRTYTPTWHRVHAIRYDLAGGTLEGANPTSYTVTSPSFTLVNPTRPGHDFAGWAGLGSTRVSLTVPTGTTGDLSLVATWTRLADAKARVRLSPVRRARGTRQVEVSVSTVPRYAAPTGKVTVKVTGRTTRKVRGRTTTVRVTRTVRVRLRDGAAIVTLPKRLPTGRYRVVATYAGDESYAQVRSNTRSYHEK